jgi:hypothetical protein
VTAPLVTSGTVADLVLHRYDSAVAGYAEEPRPVGAAALR